MRAVREPGQSQASADALAVYMSAGDEVSDARLETYRLARELRRARAVLKEAEIIESRALRRYEAVPWGEAGVDALGYAEAAS
jgi:hypothetical protein